MPSTQQSNNSLRAGMVEGVMLILDTQTNQLTEVPSLTESQSKAVSLLGVELWNLLTKPRPIKKQGFTMRVTMDDLIRWGGTSVTYNQAFTVPTSVNGWF